MSFLREFGPEILVGAGLGLVVGAVARKAARDAIAQQILLGGERITGGVESGRQSLLLSAPLEIKQAVRQPVDAVLMQAGLTRSEVRRLIDGIERARRIAGGTL